MTTSRSICPDTSAGRPPGRSSRPTIETSARLPAANTGAKRASAIRASDLAASACALLLGPAVGIAGQIGQRGLAAALGGDIGQRLQQPVHQRAALQRAGALHQRLGRSAP